MEGTTKPALINLKADADVYFEIQSKKEQHELSVNRIISKLWHSVL